MTVTRTSEGISMSAVDLEALPGLGDICQGGVPAALERELEIAIADALDPQGSDGKRTVTLVLGCRPDADGESVTWAVEGLTTKLPGGRRPKASRVRFLRRDGVVSARAVPVPTAEEVDLPPMDDRSPIALGIDVEALFTGDLDLAFRRASIGVYLDVDDRRKKTAHLRTITMVISLRGDDDRSSVKLELEKCAARLAPGAKKPAQRLYVNRRGAGRVLHLEPDAHLLHGVGQQAVVDNVLTMRKPA